MCVNPAELLQPRNCFSKMVVSLSSVESARFSVRLLARNFFTAFCTVTSSGARGGGSPTRIEDACSSAASSICLRLSSAFSQLRVRAVSRTGDPFRMPRTHLGQWQRFQKRSDFLGQSDVWRVYTKRPNFVPPRQIAESAVQKRYNILD